MEEKREDRERAKGERRARSEAKWREEARKEHTEERERERERVLIKHAHRDYREQVKALFLCRGRGLRVCGYLCGAMLRRYPPVLPPGALVPRHPRASPTPAVSED